MQSTSSETTQVSRSYARFCANWRSYLKDRVVHPQSFGYWPGCLAVDEMSREQLLELQQERLKALVDHVVQHVPFYRRWAKESGFEAGDRVRIEDLPIVTKPMYRAELEAFQSDAYGPEMMMTERTSGSTGEPFRFRALKGGADYNYCCMWRGMSRHGVRAGDRRVLAWGRNPGFDDSLLTRKLAQLKMGVREWLANSMLIDAHALDQKEAQKAVRRIRKLRPVYLQGYVSALYLLARELLDSGRGLEAGGLKAVFTESERLHDFQRQALRQAFDCPIVEHYGSVEFGFIAQEDPQGHMRINEDQVIVEALPSGEALLTNLMAHAFPFIRYRNGDMVELGRDVPEGLPYGTIAKIGGRTIDLIPVPRGGYVHGFVLLWAVYKHQQWIQRYQIHQVRLDEFKIRCIVSSPIPQEIRAKIAADIRSVVGEQAKVDIEEVGSIPTSASGKYRWVVSDVSEIAQKMLAEAGEQPAAVAQGEAAGNHERSNS